MTPQQMLEAAAWIIYENRRRVTEIVRNQVGNLSVMDGEEYIGWIDVLDGSVNWLGEEA